MECIKLLRRSSYVPKIRQIEDHSQDEKLECYRCRLFKPREEFWKRPNTPWRGGKETRCKSCSRTQKQLGYKKNVEKARKRQAEWRNNNLEKARELVKNSTLKRKEYYRIKQVNNTRFRRHRVTAEEYKRTLEKQDGKCYICGTDNPGGKRISFCVDHCHLTNINRGLLCFGCNIMLGCAQDSTDVLLKAIQYLMNPPGIVHIKEEVCSAISLPVSS